MKMAICSIISLQLLVLPFDGLGVEEGTRQQTIIPRDMPPEAPGLAPSNVSEYVSSGYGQWDWGPGENEGVRLDLVPAENPEITHAARLLSFFSIADVHMTDKESPAQVPYVGWSAGFLDGGTGGLNQSAYSPVILHTTQRLNAAIKTVNALHRIAPFDFGISLGDVCNSGQYNELRWFIDVMDGKYIRPSSGARLGEIDIDYQLPFQADGLNPEIPWYEVIGNHDQFWMGIGYPTEKIRQALVGGTVLEISTNGPLSLSGSEGKGIYTGIVDGSTPFGDVIDWGPTNLYATPPTVAADTNRHIITTDITSPTNYINEFFNSSSFPAGHGFSSSATGCTAACYSFLPLTNMPIKVIVLDNTCKSDVTNQSPVYYGGGWIDAARYTWLTNELQEGQSANQLIILACHIPIRPQQNLFETNSASQFYPAVGNQTETNLIATLHNYPNLIMVIAGHRHINTVTPFPSPDPEHPEYGFWEVETPSLRDFPQQLRTWEILRNSDNSISILTTDIDPVLDPDSPEGKSREYAVGAGRIFGNTELTNATPHTYNAELVKPLSPVMQTVIAGCGGPLGHRVAIDCDRNGNSVGFLGKLQSKDNLLDPAWTDVSDATNSPYIVPIPDSKKFYRAVE